LAELLRQPEFTELSQVQTLIQLLEDDRELLWPLLVETLPSDPSRQDTLRDRVDFPVSIRIGSENPLEPIRTCTLISTTYNRGSVPVGSVGILGPTRMVYENAIAMVKATADYLSEAIAQSA
jgi:heat-inducible transcriptional repressor